MPQMPPSWLQLVARWAPLLTGCWLIWEFLAFTYPCVWSFLSISWLPQTLPSLGLASAIGVWLTAILAWAGERSMQEVEDHINKSVNEGKKNLEMYFAGALESWSAIEKYIAEQMLDWISGEQESQFWFAAYWLGFGADAHDWDFSKAPVPQRILARVEAPRGKQGETHLILLHPNDDPDEDDLKQFITALVDRYRRDNGTASVPPVDQLKSDYKRWLHAKWTSSFKWFAEQQNQDGYDPWDKDYWCPREYQNGNLTRLVFTKIDLPFLVALAAGKKGTRAVIMLSNTRSLAENGPLGGIATEDRRLTEKIKSMLEKLEDHELSTVGQ